MIRRFSFLLALAAAVLALPSASFGQAIIIDTFDDGAGGVSRPGSSGPTVFLAPTSVPTEFGGDRTLQITGSGNVGVTNTLSTSGSALNYSTNGTNTRTGIALYDLPSPLNLPSLNLYGFSLYVTGITGSVTATLVVTDTLTNETSAGITFSSIGEWFIPFSSLDGTVLSNASSIRLELVMTDVGSVQIDTLTAVPEPSTWALIGAVALVGGGRLGWKRLKRRSVVAA